MINRKKSHITNLLFQYWGIICLIFVVGTLFVLVADALQTGGRRINWQFLTSLPSRLPEEAGIYTALMGSFWVLIITMLIAFPIGIASAIYMEEYSKKNFINKLFEINMANLAGVPSIIYGLLGLELLARNLKLGGSILTGSLTLSLLLLPTIIVTTREALRAVPSSIREASYALGASKWQTIWHSILPGSLGGILTGIFLSISRAMGEAAPLIVVGALAYVPYAPSNPLDNYTVLPIQIFNWISRPQQGFSTNASAAIIVLLIFTFSMTGLGVYFRGRWRKKIKW